MKRIALISFAAMAALMSCQKEGLIEKTQSNEPLVFTASIAPDQTKTTLSNDNTKEAKIYWETADQITITDAAGHVAVYQLESGAGTSSGTFEFKSGDALDASSSYTATYGTMPLASQVYSATGSVPLYMDAPSTSSTDGLMFTARCGILRVTIADATHEIMRVEASDGTNTYKVTAPDRVKVSSATDFYLALPAGTYTSLNIYDDNFRMASQTGISLEVKSGYVKPAASSSLKFSKCTTKGFRGAHAVVQLWEGGPFWAETNIGATTETEYGQYFAWGYPDGCVRNSDNTGWVLAKDRVTVKTFDSDSQTGFPEFVNHKYENMASANWGSDWSVPTDAQFRTLIDAEGAEPSGKCSVEYVKDGSKHWKIYQVNGILVTGTGDYASNSIFLPAAGWGGDRDSVEGYPMLGATEYGLYWSSVRTLSNVFCAYVLEFVLPAEDQTGVHDYIKYLGHPVRPVRTSLQ